VSGEFVKDIPKWNGKDVIRVSLSEFEGHTLIGLRIWYKPDENSDELRPTQKGIAIPAGLYSDLKTAILELEDYI
jgi:hypothetical protein